MWTWPSANAGRWCQPMAVNFFLSEMRVSKSFKLWLCNSSGVWVDRRNRCFQFGSRNGGRWTIFAVFETRVALATTVLRELRPPVVPEWAVVCGLSNETGRWRNCCGMPNLTVREHPRHRSPGWNTWCCTGADERLWNWRSNRSYEAPKCNLGTWTGVGEAAIRNVVTDETGGRHGHFLCPPVALRKAWFLTRRW